MEVYIIIFFNLYFLIAFTLLSCGDFSKEIERQRAEKLKEQREEELKKTDETREKILNFIKRPHL